MRHFLLLSFIMFSFLVSFSQSTEDAVIKNILTKQAADWNKGDLVSFMQPYWKSDSLMFIGKTGVTYGWNNTLKNYQAGYPDTASMGKLHFDIIQVKRLSVIYYSVAGKWNLKRSVGDLSGHFTLLLRKIKNKWVIISDHSS